MILTGKNVIISLILLGMVVAGFSIFVSDTSKYYEVAPNSTYQEAYSQTADIVQNMSSISKTFQKDTQGEGGVIGEVLEGIVAIPKIFWSLFTLIIVTPISLSTTLLSSVLGLAGIGGNNTEWIAVGLEAIIIISIVWVVIRARFRYDV